MEFVTMIVVFILVSVAIVFFANAKLITNTGLVVAVIFLIFLSFNYEKETMDTTTYFTYIFWRYICVYSILLFLVADTLHDLKVVGVYYNHWGEIIGFEYNPLWMWQLPGSAIITVIIGFIFDGLVSNLVLGSPFASFHFLGYAGIVFAVVSLGKLFLSVRTVIKARQA